MKKEFNPHSPDCKLESGNKPVNDELIDEVVNNFLSWKLPNDFSPDAGITFEPEFNIEYMKEQGKPPMRNNPTGTNLFNADQAREMIEHILTGSNLLALVRQNDSRDAESGLIQENRLLRLIMGEGSHTMLGQKYIHELNEAQESDQ